MDEIWLISGMFLATYPTRYLFLALAGRVRFPIWLQQALAFVPPVVLMAIVVPAVVMPKGEIWLSWHNAWLMAGIASLLIALWRKDLLTTIVSGMIIFLLLRWWLG